MTMTSLQAVPLKQKQANAYIQAFHRHHGAVRGDIFRIGVECNGRLVGVVMVGRPVARALDNGKTCEVLRLCTDGTPNACSFLYAKAARVAKEMGFCKIITYILDSEPGASLKASGWKKKKPTPKAAAGAARHARATTPPQPATSKDGRKNFKEARPNDL